MNKQQFEEALQEVRDELNSLGSDPNGRRFKDPDSKQVLAMEKSLAQKNAKTYLSAGLEVLEAVGRELVAAIMVALSPEHLRISLETQAFFNAIAAEILSEDESSEEEFFPSVLPLRVDMTTDETGEALNLTRSLLSEHKEFWLECLFLASQVCDLTGGQMEKLHAKAEDDVG